MCMRLGHRLFLFKIFHPFFVFFLLTLVLTHCSHFSSGCSCNPGHRGLVVISTSHHHPVVLTHPREIEMMKSGTCPLLPTPSLIISSWLTESEQRLPPGVGVFATSSSAGPICSPDPFVLFSGEEGSGGGRIEPLVFLLVHLMQVRGCVQLWWHHVESNQAVEWPAVWRKAPGDGMEHEWEWPSSTGPCPALCCPASQLLQCQPPHPTPPITTTLSRHVAGCRCTSSMQMSHLERVPSCNVRALLTSPGWLADWLDGLIDAWARS